MGISMVYKPTRNWGACPVGASERSFSFCNLFTKTSGNFNYFGICLGLLLPSKKAILLLPSVNN